MIKDELVNKLMSDGYSERSAWHIIHIITQDLDYLKKRSDFLEDLLNNGVDNWTGWDDACEDRDERESFE